MDDKNGYAVFLYPQALEALGDGVKPFLRDGAAGVHLVCRGIDTGGAMFKIDLDGHTAAGDPLALELMIPGSMVKMIVSARIEEAFGFGPRIAVSSLVPSMVGAGAEAPATTGPATDPDVDPGGSEAPARPDTP